MLTLVRHGRTAANAAGLLLGRDDPPLDEVGRAQAAALAGALAGPVARVVSSPLQRARSTADAIAAAHGVAVELDERWVELDYGLLDGSPLADVPADVWRRWRADLAFRPRGGETLVELGRRVRAAAEELVGEAEHEHVVVVSHVSPIKAAVAWALGVGDEVAWRLHLAPASISRVVVRGGSPVVAGFNELAHLG